MYFVAMLLTLHPVDQAPPLTVADGVYAHAALLNILSEASPEAGKALHEMQRHKHLTLAFVEGTPRCVLLRLTFMAEEGVTYANLLINAFATQPLVRLGSKRWCIVSVDLSPSVWTGVQTWADFLAEPVSSSVHLTFVTPTAFMKQDGDRKRFTALYPDPVTLFSGLVYRWNALAGPPLPEGLDRFLQAGKCLVSSYHLQTVKFHTSERTQLGFCGWAVYGCSADTGGYLRALNALARLAVFTGVGYQTARGMGAVRMTIALQGTDKNGLVGTENGRSHV